MQGQQHAAVKRYLYFWGKQVGDDGIIVHISGLWQNLDLPIIETNQLFKLERVNNIGQQYELKHLPGQDCSFFNHYMFDLWIHGAEGRKP